MRFFLSPSYNNLGVLYRDEGRITEAIQHYEQCLKLDPTSKNAGQNRLLALNYAVGLDVATVSAAHCDWGQVFASPYASQRSQSWPQCPLVRG